MNNKFNLNHLGISQSFLKHVACCNMAINVVAGQSRGKELAEITIQSHAAKFRNSGQTCVCVNRVQVQEGVTAAGVTLYDEPRASSLLYIPEVQSSTMSTVLWNVLLNLSTMCAAIGHIHQHGSQAKGSYQSQGHQVYCQEEIELYR